MKLIKFTFHDRIKNWGFTDLKFDGINLFIGASGVGKSLILTSIAYLKEVLVSGYLGSGLKGVNWDLDFEIEGKHGNWKVIFGSTSSLNHLGVPDSKGFNGIIIEEEIITIDENVVLSRIKDEVNFKNQLFPGKLQANKSLLELISEDEVATINSAFTKIILGDFTFQSKYEEINEYEKSYAANIEYLTSSRRSIEDIKDRDWHNLFKLYSVFLWHPDLFQQIGIAFMAIFENVNSISFRNSGKVLPIPNGGFVELFELVYQENNVENVLTQGTLSSGMYRTLIHICELFLSPKGTVFLFDEFENSLGINCIDEITDLILSSENDYQFILTSHHPYIINNIPAEYWKLVTRHGGEVKISNVYDEGIIDKNSKHEVFTQLMQSSKFKNGW